MLITPLFALAITLNSVQPAVNSRCPVTGFDVSNHLQYKWVDVNGRHYYVYDRRAGNLLTMNPESYLLPDGTPRLEKVYCGCRKQHCSRS